MKKIILIILLSTLLVSCNEEEINTNNEVVKEDFNITVKNINDFSNDFNLEKTWKLSSSQDIKLSSQVSWRISNIFVVEWEKVKSWDIIARLEDNIANYWLALERAKNWLDKAKLNYESTENSLNKQISDLKINLDNLKIDEANSKSSLELEKLENTINKLALDYENLKISNLSTISWFKNSMSKDLLSFNTYISDVIDFSDRLLWVSYENKNENDTFEDYLWAKNTKYLNASKDDLITLMEYKKNILPTVDFNFEWTDEFESNIVLIKEWYDIISSLLDNLDITLENSIISIWSLSESQIAWYKSSITWFWSVYNANNASFISYKNNIASFLDTYRNNEESLLKQIDLLNSDKKIYVKWLDVKLEIDESTLNEAISNKDLTLRQLNTSIVDAKISYNQALSNYEKLTIRSPITWNIWNIFIDVWQEVWPWTGLFNLSNNSNNEVSISFSKDELDYVDVWNQAIFTIWEESYTWSIKSISSIADSNLKYVAKVWFDNNLNFIWDIVNVKIPVNLNKILVPLTLFSVKNDDIWFINILNDNNIEKIEVYFWKFYSDLVEIKWCVNLDIEECNNINIITNDVSKYDKEKFNLMIK